VNMSRKIRTQIAEYWRRTACLCLITLTGFLCPQPQAAEHDGADPALAIRLADPFKGVILAADDFNADGHLDLLVAGPSGVTLWAGDTQGGFSHYILPSSGSGYASPCPELCERIGCTGPNAVCDCILGLHDPNPPYLCVSCSCFRLPDCESELARCLSYAATESDRCVCHVGYLLCRHPSANISPCPPDY